MKCTPTSLVLQDVRNKSYLVNVFDTPGILLIYQTQNSLPRNKEFQFLYFYKITSLILRSQI